MTRVTLIHGINNTYTGPSQMAATWTPALLDGLGLAGHDGAVAAADVTCVAWGDLFRVPGRALGDDIPHLVPEDLTDPIEQELLTAWWAAAAAADPGVVPPAADTLGAASSVRAALRALSGSRFLAGVSERMLAFWLRQVRGYLRDPQVRAAVQQRLLAAVSGDTRVVVAHSLGSVIAYEVLCAHPEWTVTDFVTLGSPLGVRHIIYDRLRPSPGMWPHVDRWTNISDAADFVALQPRLRDLFGPRVADLAIDNGVSAHAVARYLSAKETGAAVGAAFAA